MLAPNPPLGDGVVILRVPSAGDVDALTLACQDPLIARFTRLPSPYGRDDAVAFVRRAGAAWAAGTEFHFVIAAADDDRLLGCLGVIVRHERRAVEVGYWVAAAERGRGVASRAAVLASRWALDALRYPRVELFTSLDNRASQKVAEHAGFKVVGIRGAEPGGGDEALVAFELAAGAGTENAQNR